MTAYNPSQHGAGSRLTGSPSLKEAWQIAGRMDRDQPGPEGSHWVPLSTTYWRDDLNPRRSPVVDRATVEQYAAHWRNLPPILVQKDTFTAIGGRQRWEAHNFPGVLTECILVREVDAAVDELRELAFTDNASHGRPLTRAERLDHFAYLWAKYRGQPGWNIKRFAEGTGLHPQTVKEHMGKLEVAEVRKEELKENPRLVADLKDGLTLYQRQMLGAVVEPTARVDDPDWDDDTIIGGPVSPAGSSEATDGTMAETFDALMTQGRLEPLRPGETKKTEEDMEIAKRFHWQAIRGAIALLADCVSNKEKATDWLEDCPEKERAFVIGDVGLAFIFLDDVLAYVEGKND